MRPTKRHGLWGRVEWIPECISVFPIVQIGLEAVSYLNIRKIADLFKEKIMEMSKIQSSLQEKKKKLFRFLK